MKHAGGRPCVRQRPSCPKLRVSLLCAADGDGCGRQASAMPISTLQAAKRAFVSFMKAFAVRYSVVLEVTRESPDAQVRTAFRKLSRTVHPDRSGETTAQQELNAAHEAWASAMQSAQPRGRQRAQGTAAGATPGAEALAVQLPVAPRPSAARGAYRIQSLGVLLTYQKFSDESVWQRFVCFVEGAQRRCRVCYWCATMETNADGTYHLHAMLQFTDARERMCSDFAFEGVLPNVRAKDLLGEAWGGRNYQKPLDRGFFYVWAAKEGTAQDGAGDLCVAGNYLPAWTGAKCTYPVAGRWLDALFRAHKLSFDVYDSYIYLARDGYLHRKRNLDAIRERAAAAASEAHVAARVRRIQTNRELYQPFRTVPEAQAWLKLFDADALRYPLLVVHAPSFTGKTEWANSIFRRPLELKIGVLTAFPEAMRQFDRARHDGLVLDDVRDVVFLSNHQEKLQGKYTGAVEFASTPGGTCAYWRDLYRVPVVVTVNDSTQNLHLLKRGAHDFLGRRDNVHYLRFDGRPGGVPATPGEEA